MNQENRTQASLITISNAVELGVNVIKKVAGNEISTHVAGSPIAENMRGMLVAKISKRLETKRGGTA